MAPETAPPLGLPFTRTGRLTRLTWQLPLATGALIVLVSGGIALLAYREMRRLSVDAGTERLRFAVRELAPALSSGPLARLRAMQTASADPALQSSPGAHAPDLAAATRVLSAMQNDPPKGDGIELWDRGGHVIVELPASAESLGVPAALRRAPTRPAADSTPAWISPIQCAQQLCWYDFVARVPGSDGRTGFVVRRRRLVQAQRGSVTLISNLIGSEARLIVGDPASVWTDLIGQTDGPAVTQFSTSGSRQYRSATGRESFGLGQSIPGTPWYLWVEFPSASVSAHPRRFLGDLLMAGAVVVLLGVAAGWWLSWRITRPLAELTDAAERVSAGDVAPPAFTARGGELGVLADAFHRMAYAVREGRRTLEARVQARTAELATTIARLRVSETRFRSLAASASDAIVIGDAQGRITFVNQAGEEMLGYAPSELLGRPVTDLIPLQHRAAHGLGHDRFVKTGVRHHAGDVMELHALHEDGSEIPIDLSITGWEEDGTRSVGAILRNTTARTALHTALRTHAREVEDINRELAAFSYSVSHDLRAPLRGIRGFSQALLADHAAHMNAQGVDYLRRVDAAADRMGQLIDDLLELSRVSRTDLRREPVDLTPLADHVMEELRRRAPDRAVEFIRPDRLTAAGDPRLLRLVLQNLLDNSWKFTAHAPHARIELGLRAGEAERCYFVNDNGAGFDMRYAEKLFDVFQRLHSEAEFHGTGVGLAIVQRIVHRHGGRVWGEGVVGAGAQFSFTLDGGPTAPGG
ncbi:MAG: ATP-binding protein [Gemmatimonadaceae bacterium]